MNEVTNEVTNAATVPEQAVLWALAALPAVVGAALALSAARRPAGSPGMHAESLRDRFAGPLAVATAAVVLVLSVVAAATRPSVHVPFLAAGVQGSEAGLAVDGLAAVMAPTVAAVTLLVLVFSLGDADGELTGEVGASRSRFHGLMLVFSSAALVTTTATTLPTLLLAWEIMGAMSWALIGFRWDERQRVGAGLTAFVTTRTADLGLYVAAGAALAGGAGLALDALPATSPGWRDAVAAGVVVAALGKAAQLPFSFWLSRAMEGPSPVSALLHSATMVALGGYLLLRTQPLLAATGWAGPTVAWAGALSAIALGVVACAQRDLKQLLAASTAAQLAFVVLAAGIAAITGGVAHLVAHAATKALLFLAAGVWLALLGTRQLDELRGAARRWRVVGWSATLGAVALAGVAPLSLWATKDAVLGAVLSPAPDARTTLPLPGLLYAAGVVAAALSAAYAAKILVALWAHPDPAEGGAVDAHAEATDAPRPGLARTAPIVVLAAGAVGLGLLALPPVDEALADALGASVPATEPVPLLVSTLVALAVVLAVTRWPLPEPDWARAWLRLERAAHAVVVAPAFVAARALSAFDDRVLDRATGAVAEAATRAAGSLAHLDDGIVDRSVERVAAGVRRLGERARHPQTGQLYQYYVQAVVVVAAATLLLVTSALVR